jgi:hypothetical protein
MKVKIQLFRKKPCQKIKGARGAEALAKLERFKKDKKR